MYELIKNFLIDLWNGTRGGVSKHKKGIAILLIIGFIGLFSFSAIAFKVTESPFFCSVCHNMKPYVESWKTSSHKDVACVECHYEPGFINHLKGKWRDGQVSIVYFISGKWPGKYHAEISDSSCLQEGCHSREQLQDNKLFKFVNFSHSNHLYELRKGKKLRCTTCHGQIVQGRHLAVNESDCFICHFYPERNGDPFSSELSDCGLCHIEVPEEVSVGGRSFYHGRYIEDGIQCLTCHINIVQGDGRVPENKCIECHSEPETTQTKFAPESLHKNHVTDHKVECDRCHAEITHSIIEHPTDIDFDKSCLVCHEKRVHMGPREMYRGTGGIGVTDSPSRMYLNDVDCASCHIKAEEGLAALHTSEYTETALGKACNLCHGEGYDTMLTRWKDILRKAEGKTNQMLFEAQNILFKLDEEERTTEKFKKVQQLLNEARHNFSFVLMGKGHHNIEYALKLLNVANRRVEDAKAILISGYQPKEIKLPAFHCTTLCHTEIEKRRITFGDIEFPHKPHTIENEKQCIECHSSREEGHGHTFIRNCSECHHGEGMGKVTCEDCHRSTADLYAGISGNKVEELSSEKFGEVGCDDCHVQVVEGVKTTGEGLRRSCAECHDESYPGKVDAWKEELEGLLIGVHKEIEEIDRQVSSERKKGKNTIRLRNMLRKAEFNVNLIEDGKGVHNIGYSKRLIKGAGTILDEIEGILEK